jgi:hypothetical protein
VVALNEKSDQERVFYCFVEPRLVDFLEQERFAASCGGQLAG